MEQLHTGMSAGMSPGTPRVRRGGWTGARKAKFLSHLADRGDVRSAAARCGMSAQSAYVLRRREPGVADAWDAALVLAREHAEQVLGARAVDGWEEPVFYRGEQVGVRRRYDTRLLLAHLARLDRLADETRAGSLAGRFDELLARIAGEEFGQDMAEQPWDEELPEEDGPGLLPMERSRYGASRARDAGYARHAELVEQARARVLAEDPGRDAADVEDMSEAELFDADEGSGLTEACAEAADAARHEAAAAWDAWHARACARIDELAQGLPGEEPTPDPVVAFRERYLLRAAPGALVRGLLGPVLPEVLEADVPGIAPMPPARPMPPAQIAPQDRVNRVNFAAIPRHSPRHAPTHPRSVLRG